MTWGWGRGAGSSWGPAPSRGQGGGGPRRLPQKQGPTGVGCHTPQGARTSWVLGNNSGRPYKTYNSVGELCAWCQPRSPWGSLRASQASTDREDRGRILGQNVEVTEDTDMERKGQSELSALTQVNHPSSRRAGRSRCRPGRRAHGLCQQAQSHPGPVGQGPRRQWTVRKRPPSLCETSQNWKTSTMLQKSHFKSIITLPGSPSPQGVDPLPDTGLLHTRPTWEAEAGSPPLTEFSPPS